MLCFNLKYFFFKKLNMFVCLLIFYINVYVLEFVLRYIRVLELGLIVGIGLICFRRILFVLLCVIVDIGLDWGVFLLFLILFYGMELWWLEVGWGFINCWFFRCFSIEFGFFVFGLIKMYEVIELFLYLIIKVFWFWFNFRL